MIACICTSYDLFNKGCVCGFDAQVKQDEAIIAAGELEAARRRMREIAEWFSPIPAGYSGDKPTCGSCGHAPHAWEGYGCLDASCLCGSEKI